MAQVMSRIERDGFLKGRQEERREIAERMLTNKFGPLDDEAAAQLQALGPAQLLALLDALLSFTSRADLDEWLAAQGA